MRPSFEIYGHRGARGHYPENTLISFAEAVKMGVQWLEMDVVISKDRQVVVSHEPWMNPAFCSLPDGTPVRKARKYNLYRMDYTEIKQFDCGKRINRQFPKQKSLPAYKPLLSEVIGQMESFTARNKLAPVNYCIEVKSLRILEGRYQPPAAEFAELVYGVIKDRNIRDRSLVISFDKRILRHFHFHYPTVKTGLLFLHPSSVKQNVRALGFTPYSYHPYYRLLTGKMIRSAHEKAMKIVPWTVNDEPAMKRLIKSGVDGLISDYPDRVVKINTRTVVS